VNMVLLTLGVAGCVVGLGHDIGAADVLKTGATLNALSVVSITPGNFGIRELVLASLRSAVDIDVALILQGSSAYVLLRLVVSLAIATALRSKVISWPFCTAPAIASLAGPACRMPTMPHRRPPQPTGGRCHP